MAALRGLMLAMLAMLGGGSGDRLAPDAPAAHPDAFSLELNSWGNPVLSWRIGSDGKGEYRASEQVPGGGFGDYEVSTR
ncbi:MAG: hypothetical protein JO276_08235, partial [Sphingomonadaceae bacterium]|nr:hypothetical protein [Sphingomonadaceae bacterium]